MNIQRLFLGIVVTILLVASSSAAPVNGTDTNMTTSYYFNDTITSLITSFITSNPQTTAPITTTNATTDQPITTAAQYTTSNTTYFTTGVTTVSTSSSTSTKSVPVTTKATFGRRFDGFSFIGGMILAAGLGGIIFLVVSYLRRHNQLPYYNIG